jgi:phosphatidylcholine synthase
MMDWESDDNPVRVVLAMMAHALTATGLVTGFLAASFVSQGNLRAAFLAMFASVVIDAVDGTFARAVDVHRFTPWINGRKLDDIVDYLNYTLVPIWLVFHTDWLPEPAWLWCAFPLVGSAFAFVHEGAKEDDRGFFRGFPSYWNIVIFYLAAMITVETRWIVLPLLMLLSVLCVAPVRFVYPNRPPCWKGFFLGGAIAWGTVLLVLLWTYPHVHPALLSLSLLYPVLYTLSSVYLDWQDRRQPEVADEPFAASWAGSPAEPLGEAASAE